MNTFREQMNVVIVGHVDHGKSTLIGRLLADTGSLPDGKLEAVKANCERNAKPFEYAFLLDALKDERSQGITIDTARCFFKSQKRDYIIIDAPGHIEFLKNMVTGAARAEAAILVIDAHEGIQENSKRHGYMLSFLGIKNIAVCVNKMDLVQYREDIFLRIKQEYLKFLKEINLDPKYFIPIAARKGDNIISLSSQMNWYQGSFVLEALDHFEKTAPKYEQDFRFPVQDIYKFTQEGDDRRIIAGRVETGHIKTGDEVIFYPSQKRSLIKSIEAFNKPPQEEAFAGQSMGFCLGTQIYIRPGELMCKVNDRSPYISSTIKANIFWMGVQPFIKGKTYKMKLTTQHLPVVLTEILSVLDSSELSSVSNKPQVDRHDVAECILETLKPMAFDRVYEISETGRFVIVDNSEISGGGIILQPIFADKTVVSDYVQRREYAWLRGDITPDKRAYKYGHKSVLIVITGQMDTGKQRIAKAMEEKLFELGKYTYFLGIPNDFLLYKKNAADKAEIVIQERTPFWGLLAQASTNDKILNKLQHIQQLGELAHIFTDAGLILITTITDIDENELKMLKSLNHPNRCLVINLGEDQFPEGQVDLNLKENEDTNNALNKILDLLIRNVVLDPEYFI